MTADRGAEWVLGYSPEDTPDLGGRAGRRLGGDRLTRRPGVRVAGAGL